MKVAVVGGGINGVMSAWALADSGHQVALFERDEPMCATSSKSTKLVHGGLRYLEQGEIQLVREALRERTWWIERAPHLAHWIELVLPVYRWSRRPNWMLRIGLSAYDLLAGNRNPAGHKWYGRDDLLKFCKDLNPDGLAGGFTFYDGQMDDHALGLWAATQAVSAGVSLHSHASVTSSGIKPVHELDLIRGSHLYLKSKVSRGYLVEDPNEERVCFALPYMDKTLLGTTEVRQSIDDPIECSGEERQYLLNIYNKYFVPTVDDTDVCGQFAGVRPLIRSNQNPTHASREYAFEQQGELLTVFGGKWTTAHSLGQRVAKRVGG